MARFPSTGLETHVVGSLDMLYSHHTPVSCLHNMLHFNFFSLYFPIFCSRRISRGHERGRPDRTIQHWCLRDKRQFVSKRAPHVVFLCVPFLVLVTDVVVRTTLPLWIFIFLSFIKFFLLDVWIMETVKVLLIYSVFMYNVSESFTITHFPRQVLLCRIVTVLDQV